MCQHQVHRLPVIDEARRIQGILSLDDIAAEAWREQSLVSPRISTKDVGRTLGEIGRPGLLATARIARQVQAAPRRLHDRARARLQQAGLDPDDL